MSSTLEELEAIEKSAENKAHSDISPQTMPTTEPTYGTTPSPSTADSITNNSNVDSSTTPTTSVSEVKSKKPRKRGAGRGRGRKGSLMFTPSGAYGLGASGEPIPMNLYTNPQSSAGPSMSSTVPPNSSHTPQTSATNGSASNDDLLVDFPTKNYDEGEVLMNQATQGATNPPNLQPPASLPFNLPPSSTANSDKPLGNPSASVPGALSGDQYVAQLLKAELEGNTAVLEDMKRRGSCIIRSGGIGGLDMSAFNDDDSDASGEDIREKSSVPVSGSAAHRPLVGGFAAAAYEAARAYHYQSQTGGKVIKKISDGNKRMPPPSI